MQWCPIFTLHFQRVLVPVWIFTVNTAEIVLILGWRGRATCQKHEQQSQQQKISLCHSSRSKIRFFAQSRVTTVGASLLAMDSSAPRSSSSHALSLTTIAGKPALQGAEFRQVQAKTSEDFQLDRVTLIERVLCKSLLHDETRGGLRVSIQSIFSRPTLSLSQALKLRHLPPGSLRKVCWRPSSSVNQTTSPFSSRAW
ncbi:hypothetical protein D3C76_1000030 [compost metagenome]